jgi:hypothetical protein
VELKMKRFLIVFLVLLVGLAACTENTDLITHDSSYENEALAKKKKSPKGDDANIFTASKKIDGKKGGKITLKVDMDKSTKHKSEVSLDIPKGAFEGKVEISFTISPDSPDIIFSPCGMEFEKPLELDMKLENFWFNKEDEGHIDFVYKDELGNKLEDVDYDYVKFNSNKNYVKVKNALLWHFSRYGYIK